MSEKKQRAPRNKTLTLSDEELQSFRIEFFKPTNNSNPEHFKNKIICSDFFEAIKFIPDAFVDLVFADPPYNIDKKFRTVNFKSSSNETYMHWLESWFVEIKRIMKPTASFYFCGDWRSSSPIQSALEKFFILQNRITWEREKGRAANSNWKNSHEDIWFCTNSENFSFNLDAVKIKRKVIAPYKISGEPKDWAEEKEGNFRITAPSNLWTDISVPFWSMAENTEHPTQKPEKLLAKIILASSNENEIVFDPFMGSGTTCVAAKKLNRKYLGIEIDEHYCALSAKRLAIAAKDNSIQGYADGIFYERNSFPHQKKESKQIFFGL